MNLKNRLIPMVLAAGLGVYSPTADAKKTNLDARMALIRDMESQNISLSSKEEVSSSSSGPGGSTYNVSDSKKQTVTDQNGNKLVCSGKPYPWKQAALEGFSGSYGTLGISRGIDTLISSVDPGFTFSGSDSRGEYNVTFNTGDSYRPDVTILRANGDNTHVVDIASMVALGGDTKLEINGRYSDSFETTGTKALTMALEGVAKLCERGPSEELKPTSYASRATW